MDKQALDESRRNVILGLTSAAANVAAADAPSSVNNGVQWNFRPTALTDGYKDASVESLMNHYLEDGVRASQNGDNTLPPKSSLRICQWNIHYLSAPWLYDSTTDNDHADHVATTILNVDADVVCLNEFGIAGRSLRGNVSLEWLCMRLENAGYTIYDLTRSGFPTVLVSRLPTVASRGFFLDQIRSAVQIIVQVPTDEDLVPVTIVGTHLEDSDDLNGRYRLDEAKALLENIDQTNDPIFIVGDLNQQRSVDYTEDEWKVICENKARRSAPKQDGVAALFSSAGFECCYDQLTPNVKRNWRLEDPPPATHWTSTVIDYTYSKNAALMGMYVLPSNLSDHRMVVCDWKIGERSS